DVGTGLHAGEVAAQTGYTGGDQHHAEPDRDVGIETVGEELEGERTRSKEENPDPDRPVSQAVGDLVAGAKFSGRQAPYSVVIWSRYGLSLNLGCLPSGRRLRSAFSRRI